MKISFPKSSFYATLSSVFIIFGNSPFFLPLLPFLGFSLWFRALRESRNPFLLSFLIALPYWLFHSLWIYNLDVPNNIRPLLLLGVLTMSLILSVIWAFWGWAVSRFKGLTAVLFGSFLFVSLEFIRGENLGDLSYPWALVGESLVNSPFLKLSALFGVYFLSFFVVLVGGLISLWSLRYIISALIMLSFGILWNFVYKLPKPSGEIKVAILQPNILPRLDFDPKEWEETFKAYREITENLGELDLVVASESAFPGIHTHSQNSQKIVSEILERTKAPILFGTGGVERDTILRYYNRALLVDTSGKIVGFYDKVRLVPFGENLPFYEFLPEFIREIELGQGNYSRGRGFYPISYGNLKIGVMICYESIFSGIGKRLVDNGANVLAVITSDGWFGKSLGPVEHFYLGIPRAVETGRYLIRSAKTGISAIIDPEGRVVESLELYTRGSIVGSVKLYEHRTPFVSFGFLFPYLCLILSLLIWILRKRFIGLS
ncbi:MAG: apolipoprotein N-acyltransferase [Candidatus Caldipriscus sp.]